MFFVAKRCSNIVRKAKIEAIAKKILPEHQKHVDDVCPKVSMGYNEFCNELDKLYANYDINNYAIRELKIRKSIYDLDRVKELTIAKRFNDAKELFLEVEKRKYDDTLPLNQEEIISLNTKRR